MLAAVAAVSLVVACAGRFPARPAITGLAALAAMAVLPAFPFSPNGQVELHVLDVGQGDAILLRTNAGHWVLLDAGPAWPGGDAGRATVLPYILHRGGMLEAFVLSHPHTDHVGGAASVLTAMRPRAYWDAAFAGGSEAYIASLAAARKHGIEWHRVHPGDSIRVDGVIIAFLAPDSAWTVGLKDPNLASTIALVRYGMVRFLLVGDAERAEEDWLLAKHRGDLRAPRYSRSVITAARRAAVALSWMQSILKSPSSQWVLVTNTAIPAMTCFTRFRGREPRCCARIKRER